MRMLTRPTIILTAVFAAACTHDSPTAAVPDAFGYSMSGQQCDNFTFHLVGYFTSPTTGEGTFTGDLDGTMTFEIKAAEQRGRGATFLRFDHTFTTDDGSFSTADTGVLTPSGQLNDRMTIIGGTGMFEGASGRITSHGFIDSATATGEVTYHARICT